MAKQVFVQTSQVGTKVVLTNPSDFRHLLKLNLVVAPKNPHNVSNGVRLYNSKWTMRETIELQAPQGIVDDKTIFAGTEKISIFLEVSGSVENKAAVQSALTRFLANASMLSASYSSGLPDNSAQLVAVAG